jgi:dTDP-4-dehydrorhamnose 3,5-epimerase
MTFAETPLKGAFVIDIEPVADERGFFARSFCTRELEARGLCSHVAQCSISYNRRRGTLRGMHLQRPPHAEVKLVRCTSGSIYDVIVDLRPDSQTFTRHFGVELSARNRRALYVPEGYAHGFQSLEDDTEVFYQISSSFAADAATGFRWNDPAFAIEWPLEVSVISDRDRLFTDFREADLRERSR